MHHSKWTMTHYRTLSRDLIPAFFTLIATALHAICCLLPLYTSFALMLGNSAWWGAVRPYLVAAQFVLLVYGVLRIFTVYPDLLRARVYIASVVISVLGILLGMRDVVRSPGQEQTKHILDNLKYQETVSLAVRSDADRLAVGQTLSALDGVKWKRTEWWGNQVIVHFHSGVISEQEIVQALLAAGLPVELTSR